jgi:dephospho-CoA kinase
MTSSSPSRLVVGLTGPNAAGKGEAARYLVSRGLAYHSLSDVIREEAAKRGLSPTRENLIEIGNELRRRGGAPVLAERILPRLSGKDVVDSIRNPSEVEALRRDPGFILMALDAPPRTRYSRARERGRPGDGSTFEEFAEREEREKASDPAAQQLHRTTAMADVRADNSGTLQDLHEILDRLLGSRL